LNRLARALAQGQAALGLIEAGIEQGGDLLKAPGGDLQPFQGANNLKYI
jgi:hypothetical protein